MNLRYTYPETRLAASMNAAKKYDPVVIRTLKTAIFATKPDQGGIPPRANQPAERASADGKLEWVIEIEKSWILESETQKHDGDPTTEIPGEWSSRIG